MARADELKEDPARPPWWCLGAAALFHAVLLGISADAVDAWRRDQPPPRPASTPAAVKVRHLGTPAEAAAATQAPPPAPAAEESPTVATEPTPPPASAEPSVAVDPGFYVPRALLTVAPVVRTPVLLQWPANWPLRNSYTAVLKLYLDERGRVDRVEPDGDAVLPGPLFESARQAFLAAEFKPGELDGQAVKSWVRIEVNFETADAPSTPSSPIP